MKQEIKDLLYNKTIADMTIEDYLLLKDIEFEHFDRIQSWVWRPIFPVVAIAGVVMISLLSTAAIFYNCVACAIHISACCLGAYLTEKSTSNSKKDKQRRKFYKENFTKEDLKQLRKDKVFKRIKALCEEFESTEEYARYIEQQKLKKTEQPQNGVAKQLERNQAREKTNEEVAEVFVEFEKKSSMMKREITREDIKKLNKLDESVQYDYGEDTKGL